MKRLFFGGILVFAILSFFSITAAAESNNLAYVIKDGTTYYESSSGFGSGRHNIVRDENTYTTEPCYAGINGYSFLDKNGHVLESKYDESTKDIAIPETPEGTVKTFKHFCSTYYRNGWVEASNVEDVEKNKDEPQKAEKAKEQTPDEFANMIQQFEGKTAIIIDRSGSMSSFAKDATAEFWKLELKENIKIYAFATEWKEISLVQVNDENIVSCTMSMDFLLDVLNELSKYSPEHIVIISDLLSYMSSELLQQPQLKTVDIYVPYLPNCDEQNEIYSVIERTYTNAVVTIREFQ